MSPNLILTTPNQDELIEIWTSTQPSWGAALSVQGYIEREKSQVEIPLARNGGLSRWILTDESSGSSNRPVLSSCETLRKRGLVRDPTSGEIKDVTVHGVASVFTDDKFRRKGYAGAMMGRLGDALQAMEKDQAGSAHFSVLYSDIGKEFYAKHGWKAFESDHLEFPVSSTASQTTSSANIKHIGPDDLAPLAEADEALLRRKLADAPASSSKNLVAILPELDQFLWHTTRESLQCEQLFSRKPTTHGVVYTSPTTSARVWAIWKRNHSATISEPEKNTLFILRFVVEDEAMGDEELSTAIETIMAAASKEAAEWACGKIEMWNPSARVRTLSEKIQTLNAKYIVRESDSITALRWHGVGSADDVEWLANEKYAWC
jgi:hypothetical protein